LGVLAQLEFQSNGELHGRLVRACTHKQIQVIGLDGEPHHLPVLFASPPHMVPN
jgi:hypothetical protein